MSNSIWQQWLMLVTGYDDQHVIKANQNGRVPDGDYATFLDIVDEPDDFDFYVKEEENADQVKKTFVDQSHTLLSVNIFASNGRELLRRLIKSSSNNEAARKLFFENSMSIVRNSTIRNIPKSADTKWIDRYQTDITFYTRQNTEAIEEKIKSSKIEGKFEPDLSGVIVETMEV